MAAGNDLFGADIAGQIAAELGPLLLPGTLTKEHATGRPFDSQTAGLDPTPGVHAFKGMFWQQTSHELGQGLLRMLGQDTLNATERGAVLILGGTITPAGEPEVNDLVEIEGAKYRITRIADRDPDKATYVCHVA